MKLRIIILLTFFSSLANAQRCGGHDVSSFDLYYGYRSFTGNFYNQFNQVNKLNFNSPLQVIGVGFKGYLAVGVRGYYRSLITYDKIIPQTIRIQDTLRCKVTGFTFGYAYTTAIVKVPGRFSLDAYLGFNTGRIKCTGNELVRQKNPFFSPKIGLLPKANIGRVSISVRCEYEYDISRSNWRKTLLANDATVNLAKFKQSGITALLGVGYVF